MKAAATYWNLRLAWYRTDKELCVALLLVGVVVALLGVAAQAVFKQRDETSRRSREFHADSVACLARNVYFEARGEPAAGQLAVAEVTMNRKASALFPRTVCAVVYQAGAFSWTGFRALPEPAGEEWERARKVAETVYYRRHTPVLEGALFYHATYVKPGWTAQKRRVARIGNHVFYK